METEENEKLLTTNQLAEKLQVTRQTILNWRKAGKVREYKVGSTIRFKLSEVLGENKEQ